MRLVRSAVLAALIAIVSSASASVSTKNGNFFIGYTMLKYEGGIEPTIEITYNSKSSFDGMYGFGWGSDYEIFLVVGGDGTLTLHENGGGAQNPFHRDDGAAEHPTPAEVDAEVAQVLSKTSLPEGDLAKRRARLASDERFREDEWERLLTAKKVTPPDVPVGTVFRSEKFGHQTLTRAADGYLRAFENGKSALFSREGRVLQITDANSNELKFRYDAHGYLVEIADNLGRKLALTHEPVLGKVVAIRGADGKNAAFRYRKNELVGITSEGGDRETFTYSPDGRHNLVQIGYTDASTLQVDYYPRDRNEGVRLVKDRDGSSTLYGYAGDGPGGDHYATGIETVDPRGTIVSTSKNQYFETIAPSGARWTSRLVQDIDSDHTDTSYVKCGASRIERNGDVVTIQYDEKCHIARKETPSATIVLGYDPVCGKVTHVERQPRSKDQEAISASYSYDPKGNLVHGETSDGKRMTLAYDGAGRMASIENEVTHRVLRFSYGAGDSSSKPAQISVEGVGAITMTYAPSGEVKMVDSSGGRGTSMAVTETFQEISDLIRPAEVSTGF